MEETRWSVRVTAPPQGPTRAYARAHSFEGGAPLSFDVEHPQVTALEYLLGAVGLEIAGGVRLIGRKRRVSIDDVEVLVHGRLGNPLVFLRVVGEEGDPALEAIEVKAYISSLADDEQVAAVWNEVLAICPVVTTLRKAAALHLSYQQVL